ncbi:MAG TPA: ATP-binding protein [Hanamia sp.]|nr:ATP-binding protein [Hanamia sp.]
MSRINQPIEQENLELEKKLLEAVNDLSLCKKENEEFVYIASHDLKAPLRKLSNFMQLLKKKVPEILSEEAIFYFEKIEKTVADMQSLIDGLSALAEVEASNDYKGCDLNMIMEQVLQELSIRIKQKNATINLCHLPVLNVNFIQLKEVFKNIIDNSLKFQPEGQCPQITIRSEILSLEEKIFFNLDKEKIFYKIRFEDNGIGFKQENAAEIFKPFRRLNGRSAFPGNGVGLAICNKIIKMHHGVLFATSVENCGSVFIILLPQIP